MKKYLSTILFTCLIAFAVNGWSATVFNDTIGDHKWSTAGNWSDGKPDAADAVTIAAAVTALNIDEAAGGF